MDLPCSRSGETKPNGSKMELTVDKMPRLKLLQLPVDDDSVILVNEEEASTPAFNKNAKSVQEVLDCLKSEVLNLWSHIKEKPNEEDLRSENSRLREITLSLKEENKKLVQERDSLSFALQIVSREAATQCRSMSNTSNEHTIVQNMDESTPCANKEQGFIVKSKNKRKKSKGKGGPNNTLTGKESEPEKQPKERTTLLIGDSMISRIPGKDLGKAVGHRVIVKPFSGATTMAMNRYLKPNLESSPNEVILHIGTNDLKTREPKAVAESIVDLARHIEGTYDTAVTLSELVCRKDKLDQAVKTANKHLKKLCHQNGWKLIHHENISHSGLNKVFPRLWVNYRGVVEESNEMATKYFTHEKSYPVPQTSTEFADVNFMRPLPSAEIDPKIESAMKEFMEKYRHLRQRTVREETNKDRAGGSTTGRLHEATRFHQRVDLLAGLRNDFNF
ncbi:hypothetical protein AWC38_SpisGene23890 [Stylophora pistillata]|uniref:SGNH hydrolase-type esterase domain-containing protein n=1 Tax=Stylophora pistillata TaxID=50429 RepID=A0A2B4R6S4_STYPI|nr:hypothetical protein AWC38_SpisGene23890 [Stylophora pistillata]